VAETKTLLVGLMDYRDTLGRHIQQMDEEFQSLNRMWSQFEMVYHGDAAYEFKSLWMRTSMFFQDYMERTRRILQVLEERIAALQILDHSSST